LPTQLVQDLAVVAHGEAADSLSLPWAMVVGTAAANARTAMIENDFVNDMLDLPQTAQ